MGRYIVSSCRLLLLVVIFAGAGMTPGFAQEPGSKNRFFRGLATALEFYKQIQAQGGWPQIPDGPTLKPGMDDPRVVVLRQRLSVTGDYLGVNLDGTVYDEELKEAVIAYQNRNGQEPDGAVGKATIADMNIPVSDRIRQIQVNEERWRRMPEDMGARFVLVNMAGYELNVYEGEKTVLDMKVIVGKDYHSTPMFSDIIRTIEFNPYWNVPESIANKELVPDYIKGGTAKAEQDGFEIVRKDEVAPITSVKWEKYAEKAVPFNIRQRPGPTNALGEMKFLFPNKHNVYLHDTNARGLFSRTVRTFSHGCVRLERPRDLATYLLQTNGDWSRERIDAEVASKENISVELAEPVQVHLAYMTAWVDSKGYVNFRPDIYQRDKELGQEVLTQESQFD